MKIILTLFLNLFLIQHVLPQSKIISYTNNNTTDFEKIYTDGSTFTIKGKLVLGNRDFLEFYISRIHGGQETLVVECNPDGSFEKTFPIIGGQNIFFRHDEDYSFIIQAQDTLELYQESPKKPLQIIQKDAQTMRDMEEKIRRYNIEHGKQANAIFSSQYKDLDHKNIMDTYFNELVRYIYNARDTALHDPRIDDLIDEEYWRLNQLLMMAKQSIELIEYQEETIRIIQEKSPKKLIYGTRFHYTMPQTVPQNTQKDIKIIDTAFIASQSYRRFLECLLDYSLFYKAKILSYRTSSAGSLMQSLNHIIANYGFSGLITENMLYGQIVNQAQRFEKEDVLNSLAYVKNFTQSPYLKSKLAEFESFYKTLNKGMPAANFEFEDRHGKVVKLSDLRGKVVYLDFWGIYCGPCIYENKIAPEIYVHYQDQDIIFVNVCIDADINRWKAQLKEEQPNVIDLYAVKKKRDEYVKAYNISGIPHYYIIDKDGNIYNNNAPRPSSLKRNLKDNELSRLLNQN